MRLLLTLGLFITALFTTPLYAQEDTTYTKFSIGPFWDSCTSNDCGIEFGGEAGIQGEFEIGKEYRLTENWVAQVGPSLTVGVIPLHGRNTDNTRQTADGEYLVQNSILLNARLGYRVYDFIPYIELSGGGSSMTTTFGGHDFAGIIRPGLGIDYMITDDLSIGVSTRYYRTTEFAIGPYESDGLDGLNVSTGFTYRF